MNTMKRCLGMVSILATVFTPVAPALAQHGTHSIAAGARAGEGQ